MTWIIILIFIHFLDWFVPELRFIGRRQGDTLHDSPDHSRATLEQITNYIHTYGQVRVSN